MTDDNSTALMAMTTGIVANYVANNRVGPAELPGIIVSVHGALTNPGGVAEEEAKSRTPGRLAPSQIRKLVTPATITSLIDGRKFKSLRRHVTANGYTAESYRKHFGLPGDFPMVSSDYAAARSAIAKASGLGRKRKQAKPAGELSTKG